MAPGDNGIHSILSANDADHARYRRLLSHAFSEKALRQQEYLQLQYIDLLISRLTDHARSNDPVIDIVKWLNFTTFDIVGDLSLGESFHCLEESRYHGWVSILFSQFKSAAVLVSLRFFGLDKIVKLLLPSSLLKKRVEHANFANERIHRRLNSNVDAQRNDFMTYVLRYNDEKGMSIPEIETTFRTLVLAGSETTSTTLSGIMSYLLRNADVYSNLATEVRQSFAHESEITAERVNNLEYLGATIDEGLRLCTPVALGMPRVVPAGGAKVSGQWLPAGVSMSCTFVTGLETKDHQTHVSASGYASNLAALNFPDRPEEFDPQRWLRSGESTKSPSAYNPFSLGPRNCLGRSLAYLEMRLILARLFWHFDFERYGEVSPWTDQKSWILWEKRPLSVRLKVRQ